MGTTGLEGKKIVEVRELTDDERNNLYWGKSAICLVLDDGSIVFPTSDGEGNGPGDLWVMGANGQTYSFFVSEKGVSCPHGFYDWDDCPVCNH